MVNIKNLFKHNIPFHLKANEYFDSNNKMWANYGS